MNIIPVLAVGGAILLLGKKKKRKKTKKVATPNGANKIADNGEDQKALPAPSMRFSGDDPPDLIKASKGDVFTVSFPSAAGTGYEWTMASSPPDNSIELVSRVASGGGQDEGVPGGGQMTTFTMKGAKPGYGSIVFHFQRPWMAGKAPPDEVVEIQTEIA